MTPFRPALTRHAEVTKVDATAVESHINKLLDWQHWPVNIEDITADHINRWSHSVLYPAHRDERKLSPSTVQTRLSVLKQAMARAGVMWPYGVKTPPRSKRPKWIISAEQQDELVADLLGDLCVTEHPGFVHLSWDDRRQMAHYIIFVTETGLRVEEAMRVTPGGVVHLNGKPFLEVMGTKNQASYDIIPLSSKAMTIIDTRGSQTMAPIFSLSYPKLVELWALCLTRLRVTDETATLKSLRRTFASRMAAKGCPAPILQKLMRHASLATTSQYLETIGMHEATSQWVAG